MNGDADSNAPKDADPRAEGICTPARAEVLLQRFFNRDITPKEAEELAAYWDADPEFDAFARDNYEIEYILRFLRHFAFHPGNNRDSGNEIPWRPAAETEWPVYVSSRKLPLRELVRRAAADAERFPKARPFEESEPPRRWARLTAVARCFRAMPRRLVLLGLLLLIVGIFAWNVSRESPRRATSQTVAHLSGFDQVVWGDCVAPIGPGDPIENGLYQIRSGRVALTLLGGAELVVEGPAAFRLEPDNRVSLLKGYLSADVPPQQRKLSIDTSQMNVTVLGTAFWIAASGEHSEVHLLRGKLEIASPAFPSLILNTGEAFSLPRGGDSKRFAAVPDDFLPAAEVIAETEKTLQSWDASAETASETTRGGDPELLIRFDFERIGRTVRNLAGVGRGDIGLGRIIACRRTGGCRPGDTALAIHQRDDRVDLDIPGELGSFTLTARVRLDRLNDGCNTLLASRHPSAGAIAWKIDQTGTLQLTVRRAGGATVPLAYDSPPVFTPDRLKQWVSLATTVDAQQKTLTHYVNGEAVASIPYETVPIRIGAATLGNTELSDSSEQTITDKYLAGAIDEFSLYTRALAPEEIVVTNR